jgi:hypothetical protein
MSQGTQGHEKQVTIIVNAQQKTVTKEALTFDDVVEIAFPGHPNDPNIIYTVTYRKAEGPRPEGTLVEGQTAVKIKDGTIFNVARTDKS